MALLRNLWIFLHTDLWRVRLDDVPQPRSFWLRLLRIATLSFREFGRDRCSLHASALTFYTLLSIVPVAAMAFGIAKGFGLEKILERELRENFPLPAIVRPLPAPTPQFPSGSIGANGTSETLAAARPAEPRGRAGQAEETTATRTAPPAPGTDGAAGSGPAATGQRADASAGAGSTASSATLQTGQEDVVSWLITFSNNALSKVHGGVVAGFGVVLLFWVIIKVLGNIESSFNDIWGIRKPRSFGRKFSDYLAITFLGTFLVVLAGSLTVALTGKVTSIVAGLGLSAWVEELTKLGLRLLPVVPVCGLLLGMYRFMPNTRVNWRAGLVGAVIGAALYQFVQWVYIKFQVGVANYSVIYGSFAALPLFLVWLQTSWLIVLYGAEVSFAWQNVDTYEFEPDCRTASPAFRRLVAVAIAHACAEAFANDAPPPTALVISKRLGAPLRLVNELLFTLAEAHVLSEVRGVDEKQVAYQPASPTTHLTVADVVGRLVHQGTADVPLHRTPALEHLSQALEAFEKRVADCPENARLLDL